MRIGMFCLPWTGHLNPFAGLAHELIRRGHEPVFFHLPDFAEPVRRRGFRFESYGEREWPAGSLAERYRAMSRLAGLRASQAGLDILRSQAEVLFRDGPAVIEKAGLDFWVVDQMDYAASTLAAVMRAPFATLIVTLMRNHEDGVPGFSGEPYSDDPAVQERDRRFNEAFLATGQPFRDYIGAHRVNHGLGPFRFETLWSNLAQITQQPSAFEFPRKQLPPCFHFTGPFALGGGRPPAPFPWERLSAKPLIYASLGTTQNRNSHLYEAIARASPKLDAQIVLSLGGMDPDELPLTTAGNLLVVPFAPQLEILERAVLMITHAGMNSALECLAAGVPMVAVPIAHDQPGVAARIEWTGTGVRVPPAQCDAARLGAAIEVVLSQPGFRQAAQRFRKTIRQIDGPACAATIIEQAMETRRPVLR